MLRTLADAVALREALPQVKRAIVLGGGLIGMHAAENLAKGGVEVSVVEMQPHVLAGYFDAEASAMIEQRFTANGVRLLHGRQRGSRRARRARAAAPRSPTAPNIDADLLLVATGVAPVTDFLAGSGVETERGVLVDEHMRTNVANIWAAGDVAQARGFLAATGSSTASCPTPSTRGASPAWRWPRTRGARVYAGGVPLNTYSFFGQQAVSVGVHEQRWRHRGVEVKQRWTPKKTATSRSCSRTAGSPESSASTARSTRASCGS